jgi:outer membrane protein assembly factor BamE (lipoprotein component of BamABCDE complex)
MHVRVAPIALTFAITAGALIFSGCATTGGRISQHPEMYQSLSLGDQALVSQGQIRAGMTMDAVWLAWGKPDQKIPNMIDGRATETWVYLRYETPPSTEDRTLMDHSTGRISRQSSCTPREPSRSLTAELCSSDTSLRRNWSLACQLEDRCDLLGT